ncbi:MAG: Helicase associated domain protein [Ruminiclostridium sp.]|nr:Helicase associated domain protein [Ruminiclostridium sp.]
MAIELFRHNQEAYESAVAMLEAVGKACVIHPTGTGKSFIGFKLCEDNPDKTVLWLSPSEYIFKTQLENLAKVSNDYVPENIVFMTYAKLSMLSDEEVRDMHYSIVVIDEFHRTGASAWNKNIVKLLVNNFDAKILGLSATAIRYLDNQRNMADELFAGNIASEMTLGEAIMLGIIKPPKYVLSVYSYQEDFERYERRVKNSKRKITRDLAEEYLNKLRRMLSNAVGIGEIFRKHIQSIDSKFIVFCSTYEHLLEMVDKCKGWLYNIDEMPHIYKVYSLDGNADKQFDEFKADNDPDHLKLLFCIDALNEGIHIDNISGVILLRPTVSPIVYKQQIGRALTAAGSSVPLIFDIVNNVENLYSIGAIQEEVQYAVQFYEATGRSDLIENDTFKIIDEVADVKKLFAQLDETLSASWDQMYELAKDYYETHDHSIEMPVGTTYKGYPLQNWINTQRQVYLGQASGSLDEERKAKLDALGMRWITLKDINFNNLYLSAKDYFETNGDLLPQCSYKDKNGFPLGNYIFYLRKRYRSNKKTFLSDEQIQLLNSVGMDWTYSKERTWIENFEILKKFMTENPHKPIPIDLKNVTGGSLRSWKQAQIAAYRNGTLSSDKIKQLQDIGVYLEPSDKWLKAYSFAQKFYEKNLHMNIPNGTVCDGIWMKIWWENQLKAYFGKSKRKLTNEQCEMLEAIGIQNHQSVNERKWFECYASLSEYYRKHKNISLPKNTRASNGICLNKWIVSQRTNFKKGTLSKDKKELLDKIGMEWNVDPFETGYSHALRFYNEYGNINPKRGYVCPEDNFPLGMWVRGLRSRYHAGIVPKEQIERLTSLGMIWDVLEAQFTSALQDCRDYYAEHGNLNIPIDVVGSSGVKLNYWISDCRRKYRSGKLPENRISLLREAHVLDNIVI